MKGVDRPRRLTYLGVDRPRGWLTDLGGLTDPRGVTYLGS